MKTEAVFEFSMLYTVYGIDRGDKNTFVNLTGTKCHMGTFIKIILYKVRVLHSCN